MTVVVQHPPGSAAGKAGARRSRRVDGAAARHSRLMRGLRRFDMLGVVVALVTLLLSLTPSLLPRMWGVQGVVSGFATAMGYALGVWLSWLARLARIPHLPARARRMTWFVVAAFAAVTIPTMLWLAATWQNDIRRSLGAPTAPRASYVGVLFIAGTVALALIGTGRLFHRMYVALTQPFSRVGPQIIARPAAALTVAALGFVGVDGVVYHGSLLVADGVFRAYDRGDNAGVEPTTSALRSGGPGSLVPWRTLGRQGRAFISAGPTVTDIEALTRRPAVPPIRVYAGVGSAPNLHAEAQLVLAELERTGAFDRAVLAVGGTTGSGGVEGQLADPLEYMYSGNTAIAAMQYSRLPSWMAFVVDHEAARQAGRELFDTIYRHWSSLSSAHRPRLVVFGESLGAYSIAAAFASAADLAARTSGALFTGPPNQTELWRHLTASRTAGSPQRLPVYGDGATTQFAAAAADLRNPDGTLRHPKVLFVQHASDPYLWWSWSLIWHKPDWLREQHGADVTPHMRWYPALTFWQVTADLAVRGHVAAGHGHHYGPEVPTAWAAILQPPNWTDAETAALLPRVMFPD